MNYTQKDWSSIRTFLTENSSELKQMCQSQEQFQKETMEQIERKFLYIIFAEHKREQSTECINAIQDFWNILGKRMELKMGDDYVMFLEGDESVNRYKVYFKEKWMPGLFLIHWAPREFKTV